jgi:hypothetical protein
MEPKFFLKSKTALGILTSALGMLLPVFGVHFDPGGAMDVLNQLSMVGGLALSLYGRVKADSPIYFIPKSKGAAALLLLAALLPAMLIGCAGSKVPDSTIQSIGMNVGYASYRLLPASRPVLATVCLLKNAQAPDALSTGLRENLGQVWIEANQIQSADAAMIVLGLNTFFGLLDAQLANEPDSAKALAIGKAAIDGICEGQSRAAKSVGMAILRVPFTAHCSPLILPPLTAHC